MSDTNGSAQQSRRTKPPRDVQFREEQRLIVWRLRGVLNESVVNKLIAFIGNIEATDLQPFDRFTETGYVEAVDLNFEYIFHVALYRRLSYSGRAPVKSAFLLSSLAKAHYSKMLEIIMQGSPLKVRIFEERAKAARWLGVSIEQLEH
jgi:hypothetical protein